MFSSKGKFLGHQGAIYELIQKDHDHFISCSGDGYIVQWKIDSEDMDGQLLAKVDGKIFSMALVHENLLIVGDMYGDVYWIDLKNKETIRRVSHHSKGVYSLILSGDTIFSGGGDGVLTKWDSESMYPSESIQISKKALRKIIQLTDNQFLIASSDSGIYLSNSDTMTANRFISSAHDPSVFCLAVSDQFIYSGGRDAQINQYTKAGELTNKISAHWFTVNEILYSPYINLLISASRDKKIRIWDGNTMEIKQSIDVQSGGHVNSVNDLLFIEDRNILLTASDDRTIGKFVYE